MQMNPTTIIIFVTVFAGVLLLLLKVFSSKTASRKRSLMSRVAGGEAYADEDSLISDKESGKNFRDVPFLGPLSIKLQQAGLQASVTSFLLLGVVIIMIVTYILGMVFANFLLGFILSFIFITIMMRSYLSYKVDKRNQVFLDNFPDALDMIVRSVKSGHPLLSSLRMIVENSEEHIAEEFQQVVDEVSYGAPLSEALHRMADRIDLLDINFFVVILSVQQETGGNLSEVLGNLSGIIRKRRLLRLKIHAMTAEGRFTSWIFAAIPIVQLIIVMFISPEYVDVLFKTSAGNILLAIAGGFIVFSIYMSKKLCQIDI
jgi:tight adherence protein B